MSISDVYILMVGECMYVDAFVYCDMLILKIDI